MNVKAFFSSFFAKVSPGDLAAAAVPSGASLTLAEVNTLASLCFGFLGAAYLARKWYREEQAAKDQAAKPARPPSDFSI